MKNKEEINQRARQIMDIMFEKFLKERTSRRFINCKNHQVCQARKVILRYCALKTTASKEPTTEDKLTTLEKIFICDTDEWACQCPEYALKNNEEDIRKEFLKIISSPSRCGQIFPHLASLLWVLNDNHIIEENKEEKPKTPDTSSLWNMVTGLFKKKENS